MIKQLKKILSKQGRSIELLQFKNEHAAKTVLIIGVFHGDEPQGEYLINRFLEEKDFIPKNNLLIIPCLNPDGKFLNTRQNSNGVDLNRNFPTKNWELTNIEDDYFGGNSPASEEETKFVVNVVEKYSPKLILTLHAPYKIVNYDGGEDARVISEKISGIIGYPVEKNIGYPTPGSFGTWAGIERKIPTITLEIDETVDVEELVKPVFKVFEMLEAEYGKD